MKYENSWTQPGEGFVNDQEAVAYGQRLPHESVANIVIKGLNSSDARKFGKLLPKLIDAERKGGQLSSKSRGAEKRVSVKGNTVFIGDPGSGMDTFHLEKMIKDSLKSLKMKATVGSSTHKQR